MARILIADGEDIDAATVTAENEVATLPATNLQTMQPSETWRTSDATDTFIVADLGAALAVDIVALLKTNLTAAATWRVRGATSEANLTAAPGYDSTAVGFWPESGLAGQAVSGFLYLDPAQSFRWWRIDLSDAANPDGYLEAGRLYIDAAWRPARNLSFNWQLGWIDDGEPRHARGGQIHPEVVPRRRRLRFSLDYLTEAEAATAYDLDRRRGRSADVLVLRDPAHATQLHRQSVYGLMTVLEPAVNTRFNVYSHRYDVEELT
jgi:hypothetical protein